MLETPTKLSESVTIAADDLIAALRSTDVFTSFVKASDAMGGDETTQALLNEYRSSQLEFRQKQANGSLTQEDIDQIRALQMQVQSDSRIVAFSSAQFPMRSLLDELTAEFSNTVGFDFASLANVSSC